MKLNLSKYLMLFCIMFLVGTMALSTTSCSRKTGCPTMDPVDLNKRPKKSTSGIAMPGDKRNTSGNINKKKKRKKRK